MDTIIKGGWIVTGERLEKVDVAVEGEKIAALGPDLHAPGAQTYNVFGKYILPGIIDAHVHYQMPIGDLLTADDWYTGTKLAACSGVTTVIDYAEPQDGNQSLERSLEMRIAEAERLAAVDYSLHQVVKPGWEEDFHDLKAVTAKGATSYKIFTTYNQRMNRKAIRELLVKARKLNALVTVHCEDHEVLQAKRDQLERCGRTDPSFHALSRPPEAEIKAVKEVIDLAGEAGAPVYIVHVSTGGGARAIAAARAENRRVYGETCPHYLLLTDEKYNDPDKRLYLMCPPLRKAEDNRALWRYLAAGDLQVVATDHCSYSREQKATGTAFYNTPSGIPGTETLLSLMYTYGVCGGWLTMPQMVRVLSANPACLFGLYPAKGCLAPGSDADIVVFDPRQQLTIEATGIHSAAGYSPFEGFRIRGCPEMTFLRGRLIYNRGQFLGQKGGGKYVRGETPRA